jgi:ankyrin repeat protein
VHCTSYWAATSGNAELIRLLVASGANPSKIARVTGLTPLHEAAWGNHSEAVKALLEAGVDPLTGEAKQKQGQRRDDESLVGSEEPLMFACQRGQLEAVNAFLLFLEDIGTVHRALAWAAQKGQSKVVARILQYPGVDVNTKASGNTPLLLACGAIDVDTVVTLMKAGADPTITCNGGGDDHMSNQAQSSVKNPRNLSHTCMYELCRAESLKWPQVSNSYDLHTIFSLIVRGGADVNERGPTGSTPLHAAIRSPPLIRFLLDAGADVNAPDDSGSAPLHKVESLESMALLIEYGHADIDLPQDDGLTPLLCLLRRSQVGGIIKFLEYGPDCNATTEVGDGALHIAMRLSVVDPAVVGALLRSGANPNLRNASGLTPLLTLRIANSQSLEVLSLLLDAGADIDAVDGNGQSLLFRMISNRAFLTARDTHRDLKELLERGASKFVRDSTGRTLLHEAVKYELLGTQHVDAAGSRVSRLSFLRSLGLDQHAVDSQGNNLLHEAALRQQNLQPTRGPSVVLLWEELLSIGLDLEQGNNLGQRPLHVLCSNKIDLQPFMTSDPMAAIDLVISRSRNLDIADNSGLTPLHLAVAAGELYTKKLLDAGADPTITSNEGLTPLHVAARARESNIVGILLDALKRKCPEASFLLHVNAATTERCGSVTPLYYACQSGRPETVALLLGAGADAKIGNNFHACAAWEAGQKWWDMTRLGMQHQKERYASGLHGNDTSAPSKSDQQSSISSLELDTHDTTRLEEILNMLIDNGADMSQLIDICKSFEVLDAAVGHAAPAHRDYTAACLMGAQKHRRQLTDKETEYNGIMFVTHTFANLSDASDQAPHDFPPVRPCEANQELLRSCMVRREYRLIEELFEQGADFLAPCAEESLNCLGVLVQHGFASLVDKIGCLERGAKLKTGSWHAFGDKTRPGLWHSRRHVANPDIRDQRLMPLLVRAVRRELPNMDVVRLLVEKFGVDINDMHCEQNPQRRLVPVDSALLHAAKGKHWWHIRLALPYLIHLGADPNIRTYEGLTPLHIAICGDSVWYQPRPFQLEAAKALVEAGADVNAVDETGRSCLACAGNHLEIIRLLVTHGAVVKADDLFSAIDGHQVEAIAALLSAGGNANIRRTKSPGFIRKKRPSVRTFWQGGYIDDHEIFPLYHAAIKIWGFGGQKRATVESTQLRQRQLQIIRVLLHHGADPFARYLRQADTGFQEMYNWPMGQTPPNIPEGYTRHTVLHELLLCGHVAEPFLSLPGLDINHRDDDDRTLLHVACFGSAGPDAPIGGPADNAKQTVNTSVFSRLVSLNADLEAKDNYGRNALHYMLGPQHNHFSLFKDSLVYMAKTVPGLINQQDSTGTTPLHRAVSIAMNTASTEAAQFLLEVGADPLTVDRNGDTVLHILSRRVNHPALRDLFRSLVTRGVDINTRNAAGEPPLFNFYRPLKPDEPDRFEVPVEGSDMNSDALPMFQELGADFMARDGRGRGLLHMAASGHVTRFQELLQKGLDVLMEDDSQTTAIDIAVAYGNSKVLELFEIKGKDDQLTVSARNT